MNESDSENEIDKLVNNLEHLYNDNEVRPPDNIYEERLIDIEDETFNQHDIDDEIKLALDISKNEYEDETKLVFQISENEYYNLIIEESLKKERIKSLEEFCKKIKGLSYTDEDIEIRKYIESVLDDYFNLKVEFVFVENELYKKLFKIIDTYYKIPTEKRSKKTFISEEEDKIIRQIFLEYKYF